jgi:hypothetical protein
MYATDVTIKTSLHIHMLCLHLLSYSSIGHYVALYTLLKKLSAIVTLPPALHIL